MPSSSTATPTPLVFWREKLSYAAGDTASCLFWQTFSMFLMIFYTDTFGISAAAVATMFLITRIWDAALDPIMGMIADRTHTRYGKFRPWILWSILPFTLAGIALFITPNFGPTGKLAYAYATYSVMMLVYTMINVPYGALLGVISPHSQERTTLASYRFVGAFLGNIIVQYFLLPLVVFFGAGNDKVGYPLAMTVFAVAAGVLFFLLFLGTKERVAPPRERSSIKADAADLFRNTPWVMLCSFGLVTLIYISIRNGTMLYYFKYYVGDTNASRNFMVVGTIFSIIGAYITPWVTRLCGSKKRALIVLTLVNALSMLLLYVAGPKDLGMMYAAHILFSVPSATLFPLIWSMYADTADYGEWKFGRRATGLVFSAATFSQKMGWAVGGALAGYVLGWVGFVANVDQTPAALDGIRHMMSTIPALVALFAVAVASFYGISAKLEKQISHELIERKRLAAA